REGLARYRERFEVVLRGDVQGGMAAFPEQIVINLESKNAVRVRLDGSITHLDQYMFREPLPDLAGRVWFICSYPRAACWMDQNHSEVLEKIPLPEEFEEAVRDSAGRIWAADRSRAIVLEGGRQTIEFRRRPGDWTELPGPLLTGRDGRVWFLGETIRSA